MAQFVSVFACHGESKSEGSFQGKLKEIVAMHASPSNLKIAWHGLALGLFQIDHIALEAKVTGDVQSSLDA